MKENSNSQSLLLTCLARQIIRDYPSRTCKNYKAHAYGTTQLPSRNEFFANWQKRHGETSAETVKQMIDLEMRNFRGWCQLEGLTASYSNFSRYMALNPAVVLTDSGIKPEPVSYPPVAPWWSDLPHLAPNGQGVRA